jgi:hypothetical protein
MSDAGALPLVSVTRAPDVPPWMTTVYVLPYERALVGVTVTCALNAS